MALSHTLSFPVKLHSLMSTHVTLPSFVVKPSLHSQVKLPSLGLYMSSLMTYRLKLIIYELHENPIPSVLVHCALESQSWSPVLHSSMSWQVIQLFEWCLLGRFLNFDILKLVKMEIFYIFFFKFLSFFWKSFLLKPVLQTHAEISSEPFSTVVNTASEVHLHLYLAR